MSSENICTSQKVMEAWVNVFSFIMKSMLPPAINGQTLETEICINTKTEFSSDNMKAQVQEIKYEREKVLSSSRSSSVDFTDLRSVTSKDDLGFTAPLVPVKPSQLTNRTPNNASRIITPSSNKNDENGFDKSNSSSNSFRVFLPKLPLVISDKNDDDDL